MSFSPDGPAVGRWLSFAGDCRPCVQQRSFPLEQAAHRLLRWSRLTPLGCFFSLQCSCDMSPLRQRACMKGLLLVTGSDEVGFIA